MVLRLLLCALLCAPLLSSAQDAAPSTAAQAALDHFEAQRAAYGLEATDLGAAVVTDEYRTAHLGVTHVYLRQVHAGLEILQATANANVADDGDVTSLRSRFLPGLASRRTAEVRPSLSASEAIAAAAAALELPGNAAGLAVRERPEGTAQRQVLDGGALSLEPIPARLAWLADDTGALRLVWNASIATVDEQHWWDLAVDAHTGQVLWQHDWVVHETWPDRDRAVLGGHRAHPAAPSFAPLAPAPALAPASASGSAGTYRVIAFPAESPNHGPILTVSDPADPDASPNGWHDDGAETYTTTRGNNVHAYEDRRDRNFAGYSPDGGAELVFDFPFADDNDPVAHEDFAITNLFYWNNLFHDILWHYGFDEAGGNFQETNFSGEGRDGDYVRAEAQDGSGVNNANFGTPPDGSRPRMQMFIWEASVFEIVEPAALAGSYPTGAALFGPPFPSEPLVGTTVLALDSDFSSRSCTEIINADETDGKVVLMERGTCNFIDKVRSAQAAGATAAIIYNCEPGEEGCSTSNPGEGIINMSAPAGDDGADITIPALFVQRSTGLLLIDNDPAEVSLTGAARDSDLDNGVIIHEYAHGLSNRLTGGPAAASCLGNAEQAGEGWSDYYALMLTMTAEDAAARGRGIATYLEFQDTDGPGIRPAPYSTDMAVNPLTYDDVADEARISQPHGIGTVFATMLWEMTWNLIDRYGFDPDLTGGTGGNNIALQLVTDGLKLQPCNPGFVDSRDAILEADLLANDGANHDLIWAAFAKRGLGFEADQGNPDDRADGVEDFTLPPPVANEADDALTGTHRLSAVYPNPFNPQASFTLQVATAQDVSAALYDVLGRRVAVLHDGALAAGAAHRFEVDGRTLASGTYVLRVQGEDFAETRRLTLVK